MEHPGCPECWSVLRRERHHLESLIHENVNDPHVRIELLRTFGFCPRHTWLLAEVEEGMFADKSGTSILLEAFIDEWRRRIQSHLRRTSKRTSVHHITPGASCRVCESTARGTALELAEFVRVVDAGDAALGQAYDASDGFCLVHVAELIAVAADESPTKQRVVDHALKTAESLQRELREYDRLRAWDKRDEPRGDEQTAWRRAAAFFSGVMEPTPMRQDDHTEARGKDRPGPAVPTRVD